MKKIIFLVSFLGAVTAVAGPKIKQIDTSKERIAVQATKQTAVGTQWMAQSSAGTQCTMEVVDKIGNIAILDGSDCDILSQLRVGQRIQKSVFSGSQGKVSSNTSGKPPWMRKLKGFSVFGFYSLADDVPVKANGGSATIDSEASFGFGTEYKYSLRSWTQGLPVSLIGGVNYELSRKLTVTGGDASFSLWTAYVNGFYDLTENFGAFAGLNYSFPMEKDLSVKLKSQLGYQLGLSGNLTKHVAVDGIYRWINMKASGFSEVSLDGFMVRGRYIF